MALSTTKFSGLPFHNPLPFSLRCRLCSFPFSVSASSSSPLRVADRDGRSRGEGNSSDSPYPANSRAKFPSRAPSAPWLQQWASSDHATTPPPGKKPAQPAHTSSGAIERIVHRLRNLGLGVDYDADAEAEDAPPSRNERLGELLERSWNRPNAPGDLDRSLLPWEREGAEGFVEGDEGKGLKRRRVKAPTLAELTVEDEELRRLRRNGMTLRERITVPKAGITQVITEKIHDAWRKSELVRLKFHEDLAQDMKTAHELIERRTGGLVIWRSGSVMVVYRGSNYKSPSGSQIDHDAKSVKVSQEIDTLFIPDVSSATKTGEDNDLIASRLDQPETFETNLDYDYDMTPEEAEYNSLLDGLGPRFVDWWGTGVLPVDADLLPHTITGYKTPFRLLPTGMRSRLTNAEMTNLRKLAKSMPCHFALGRNRQHQGLASAILKLWEKSLVVKIAVKRGIQNTNNELMAEELKALTGGILLLRNKYYIVIYRGKDFVPTSVATALAERGELTKDIQDAEEKSRYSMVQEFSIEEDKEYLLKKEYEGSALAGTLEEFQEAQARWGREISAEERDAMKEEASRSKSAKLFKKMEHKLFLAQDKKLRAEKLLAKIEASMVPVNPSDDRETITDEEQSVFRKIGLRMKAYLPLGIRGVFDGVIENMHLHWKHRELVKLISKQKSLSFVKDTARLLQYESGGILVAIERVPKGFALIYYRGKNYKRPINLRPRNLLTKAKALKRAVAMQRHEALSQHISELEGTINQMKPGLGISEDEERVMNDQQQINSDQFPCSSEILGRTSKKCILSWNFLKSFYCINAFHQQFADLSSFNGSSFDWPMLDNATVFLPHENA